MTTRKQKTAIALTGAVALASGAYALGSQSGDGSANAAAGDDARPALVHSFRGGGPPGAAPGLDNLADKLGVEESDLREALRDVRPTGPPKPPGDFAEALADELGVAQSKVEAALERVRERTEKQFEQRRDEFAERLADRLNLDPDKVKDALDDGPFGLRRPAHP